MTHLSTIPFGGFYETWHGDAPDHAVEFMFHGAPESILGLARDAVNWQAVHERYAAAYADSFLAWLGLDGAFESLQSPRFYNYDADRVFVTLTAADLVRLRAGVDDATLDAKAAQRFTSRSGFISHYSPDWRDWGAVETWDHNQLGTLVEAYAETEQQSDWDSMHELDLMEDSFGNGDLDNWIWETAGPGLDRAYRLWTYLQARADRPFHATPLGSA